MSGQLSKGIRSVKRVSRTRSVGIGPMAVSVCWHPIEGTQEYGFYNWTSTMGSFFRSDIMD